jgi:DNA topoisomerase IA
VDRTNVEGQKREVNIVTLSKGKLTDQMKSETVGAAKNKLVPTDIGFVVNDFLMQYFENVVIPKKWRFMDKLPTDVQGKKHKLEIMALFEEKK